MMYTKENGGHTHVRGSPEFSHTSPGPPSDSSCEDSYRDKYEHLVLLVQQQQKELHSCRIRNEGIATMTACLQEQKQENEQLRTKISNMERDVAVWHSRLQSAGLSPHPSLQDGESLIPGPSKQVFDNLVRENARLKQIVKSAKMDPSALEEAQQSIAQLQHHVFELTERNNTLEKECSSLRHVQKDKSSPTSSFSDIHHVHSSLKDSEFCNLQNLVKSLEQTRQTQDAICTSAPEDAHGFRKHLEKMAEMCQSLLKKMEDKGQKQTDEMHRMQGQIVLEAQKPALLRSDSGIGEEEMSKLREEITKLKDANHRLNQECKEMLETNQRWTSYNEQRENYTHQLFAELTQLRAQLEAMSTTPSLTAEQQRDFDRLLQVSKENVAKVEEEKVKIEDENRALRLQVERLATEMERMRNQPQGGRSKDDQDRIHMLEAQVQICTEDFESERRDRERAQTRITEVESEMDLLKRQLEQFQSSRMTHLYNQRMAALSNYQNEYERRYGSSGGHERQLIARGIVQYEADGPNEDDESEGEDVVDFAPPPADEVSNVAERLEDSLQPADMLQCPRCKKDFPTDKHNQLLEHIEICCD